MIQCLSDRPAPLRCPTAPEILSALLALLPRGRAWQSQEGGPEPYQEPPFQADAFQGVAFDTNGKPGSVLYRYWAAVSWIFAFAAARLCDLRREFFCATQSETRELWMAEYGLPDDCDPFPDLCGKVAARGGARCEYLQEVAARAGWSLRCLDGADTCGAIYGRGGYGCGSYGGRRANYLRILVDLGDSPAFGGRIQTPSMMGRMRMGRPLSCGPNINPLLCLIDRVAPAHVEVRFTTI